MNTKRKSPPAAALPPAIQDLLGKRPLVTGEDEARYDALLATIAEFFKPRDPVEWLYIKDFADSAWDIQRLGGYRAKIISNDCPHALAALLQRHPDFGGGSSSDFRQQARKACLYVLCR